MVSCICDYARDPAVCGALWSRREPGGTAMIQQLSHDPLSQWDNKGSTKVDSLHVGMAEKQAQLQAAGLLDGQLHVHARAAAQAGNSPVYI